MCAADTSSREIEHLGAFGENAPFDLRAGDDLPDAR